jgi:hypothetical protein
VAYVAVNSTVSRPRTITAPLRDIEIGSIHGALLSFPFAVILSYREVRALSIDISVGRYGNPCPKNRNVLSEIFGQAQLGVVTPIRVVDGRAYSIYQFVPSSYFWCCHLSSFATDPPAATTTPGSEVLA